MSNKYDDIFTIGGLTFCYYLHCRPASCAGAYNSLAGQYNIKVLLYAKYVIPHPTSGYKVDTYASLPSVVSTTCTKIGKLFRSKGGKYCTACKELRQLHGNRSFTIVLKRWESILRCAIVHREKDTIMDQDVIDAKAFASRPKSMSTIEGTTLQAEATA